MRIPTPRVSRWLAFLICFFMFGAMVVYTSSEAAFPITSGSISNSSETSIISASVTRPPLPVLTGQDKILYAAGSPRGIYVINPNGTGKTFLSGGSYPSWSPDGTKIAFTAQDSLTLTTFLYSMNADGSGKRQLNFNGTYTGNPYLSWSPDSQKIVFQVQEGVGLSDNEIYVVKYDGTGLTRLTNNSAADGEPQWSPDGQKIVFSSSRADINLDIYMMNADGSNQTRLTFFGVPGNGARSARWSPDGTKICFVRGGTKTVNGVTFGYNQINVMNPSGGGLSVAAEFRASDIRTPNWSHDSSQIAIQVHDFFHPNSPSSYIVSPEGGVSRVARNDSSGAHDWSPDDSRIVYADNDNLYVTSDETPGARIKIDRNAPFGIDQFGTPTWKPRPPCNCPTITRPSLQTINTTWPDPDNKINWSLNAEVTDRDGLILTNVKLGSRLLAQKISAPYYNLQTSLFSDRGELKPDNVEADGTRRTRLIDYQVAQNGERLVVEATYAIDQIPIGSKTCLLVIQRYEFYKQGVGGGCEPTDKLPCSRWKPIVKYKFFGQLGQTLVALNIPQRRHFTVDNIEKNSVGLFKDCDWPPTCLPAGLGFERRENPLFDEWYGRVIENGTSNHVWDNVHLSPLDSIDEPGFDITFQNWNPFSPGCAECAHSHWRWGNIVSALLGPKWGNGNVFGLPPGSKQHFDFAVIKNNPGEDHPDDFTVLADNERIRHPATGYDPPRQIFDFSAPEDVVLWYSATGHQSGDAFYGFGGFFNGSIPSVQLYGSSGLTQLGLDPSTLDPAHFSALTADELSSVEVANLYEDGETTVSPLDPSILGPLPDGYTTYNNLSFDIETEAETSGPDLVTFTVPSVTDPTVFLNLRVFHAEQDPFEPDGVIWVDRTVLPPDPQAPDFTTSTIRARTKLLGQFVVASLTTPQPATGTANIFVSASHAPAQIIAGGDVTYTLNIINNGPDTAFGIRLADSLPPNSEFISATPSQGNCSYFDGKVVCKLQSLNSGAGTTVSIVATLSEGGLQIPAGGLEVGNTVHVRANETDPNLEDNIATDSLMLLSDPNVAPTVSLTNPSNGDLFVGPANITVTANANDTDGTIASLELFDNGSSIGTAVFLGGNEYSFSWNNVPFGDHSLLAVATDNNGKQTRSNAASIVVNGSAIVTITNPASWTEFATSASINLTANASLSGGSINKVDFYVNGELIGTGVVSGTNQYSLPWNALYSGSYFLAAVATDNSGITTTSKPVEIRVRENALPSANIIAPTNGSGFATPGNVVITANATDNDGAISLVDFYANGTKIGSGLASGTDQYSFTWSNPGAGSYSLTAIAVDDTNQSTTSSAVNITVSAPPSASINSPVNGTQYTAPAQVPITATASDSDGSIARTDFFANGSFIGTGTVSGTNQYSFNWANVGIGNYILTAVAIDNSGLSATSTGISVSVTSPVLFVANSTTLNSAENSVKARLEALNYTVVVKSAATAVTADATGKALVVISSTVTPSVVGTKFRTVTVPVVVWESGLFVDMGMTPSGNQNSGTTNNQTQVKIINASHPLAATLTGNVTVSASNAMSWGKPNANAISVATLVGDTTKSVIFGYQTGAVMPGLTAPARRVGVFMTDNTAASFTTNGGTLFDAAIKWAAGGAVITGSFAPLAPSSVNLTQAGPMYWIHWGTVSATQFDRKNFNFQLISNYTKLGGSSVGWFNDNLVSYNWSDGQPTLSTAGTTTGIFVNDAIGNGFEITVPADTNLKTLKIYVGVWYAQGRLEASFTDGSAPVYVDTTIGTTPGRSNGVYSIQFKSAAPGQTLRIRYTIQANHFSPYGNVTLESATLQ